MTTATIAGGATTTAGAGNITGITATGSTPATGGAITAITNTGATAMSTAVTRAHGMNGIIMPAGIRTCTDRAIATVTASI